MSEKKIKQLEEELEKIKKQAKEYLEGWQRTKADYINREREIERQRSEWIEFANLNLILETLPIYENLNKSLEHKESNDDFIKGLEQIKKQFDDFLKNLGVEKIKTVGEKFNPEFHEAVDRQQPTTNSQQPTENIITKEISAGYTMNGKVIKVAKVIIK